MTINELELESGTVLPARSTMALVFSFGSFNGNGNGNLNAIESNNDANTYANDGSGAVGGQAGSLINVGNANGNLDGNISVDF